MKKMKKSKILSIIVVVLVIISTIIINYDNTEHTVLKDQEKVISATSSISMMLETEASSGIYEVSTDTSWPSSGYTFNSTLSKCENGSNLSWDSANSRVIMTGNVSDRCYVYFDVEVVTLAGTITYTTDGDNNLYYMDGEGEYADYEVTDYSYRFSGSSDSVNNFVCFGSDSDTCETDNLYRIIGFFLNDDGEYEMKLIKYDYATSNALGTDGDYYSRETYSASDFSNYTGNHDTINVYSWNYVNYVEAYDATGYYNDWSYSQLNTVNLNTNYYNSLDSKWQDMITTHTWSVGGGSRTYSGDDAVNATAKVGYSYEIENPSNQLGYTTYSTKVGLMYVSDYGFAADPSYWTTATCNYEIEAKTYDWMYMGVDEWTISRCSFYDESAFYVSNLGIVDEFDVGADLAVRPVFYLVSSVSIVNGGGTIDSPYRLSGN